MCCEETSLVVNKTEGEMFTGSPVDKTERTRRYISICVLWGNVSLCVVRFCPVCVCCFSFCRVTRVPTATIQKQRLRVSKKRDAVFPPFTTAASCIPTSHSVTSDL